MKFSIGQIYLYLLVTILGVHFGCIFFAWMDFKANRTAVALIALMFQQYLQRRMIRATERPEGSTHADPRVQPGH